MNDFTKDELQFIYNYIFQGAAAIRYDHHELLKSKIQLLIENSDNYCEHEYTPTEALNVPLHCLKCGVKFE